MSASVSDKPNRSFQSRLRRVQEQRAPFEDAETEVSVLPDWKKPFRAPLAVAGALVVGALALIAARTFRADVLGGTFVGDNADMAMAIDAGLALLGGVMMCILLRYRSVFCMAGQAFGVVAALVLAHNVAHFAPGVSNALASDSWTAEIAAASQPGSIYFRGDYVTVPLPSLSGVAEEDEAETEVVKPRIIRLQ